MNKEKTADKAKPNVEITVVKPNAKELEDIKKRIEIISDLFGFGDSVKDILTSWVEKLRLAGLNIKKTYNMDDLLAERDRLTQKISEDRKLYNQNVIAAKNRIALLSPIKLDPNSIDVKAHQQYKWLADNIEQEEKRLGVVKNQIKKVNDKAEQEQINLIKKALSQYYGEKFKDINSNLSNKNSKQDKTVSSGNSLVKILETYNKSLDAGIAILAQYKKYIEKIQPGASTSKGKIPGKASGGPVNLNSMYLVGEKGPELFIPDSNGIIISNANLNKSIDNFNGGNNSNNPKSKEEKEQQEGEKFAQFIHDEVKSNLMSALTTAFQSGSVSDAIKSFTKNLGESTRSKILDDLSNSMTNSNLGQNLQNWYGKLTDGLSAEKNKALNSVLGTVGNWASGAAAGGMGSGAMLGSALGTIWGPMGSSIGGMLGGLFDGGNSNDKPIITADRADLNIDFAEANFKTVTLPSSYQSRGTTNNTNSAAPVINVNVNVVGGINGDRELERKIKQIGTAAAVEVQKTVSKWSGYTVNGVSSSLAGG